MKAHVALMSCLLWTGCNFGGTPVPASSQNSLRISQMVQETNAIIEDVKMPLRDLRAFVQSGEDPKLARLIMIGENHVNERGLKDSLRALLLLAKKGDMVLIEGNDPVKNGQQDCDYLIFRIYALQKWNELNRHYDPVEFAKFQDTLFSSWFKAKSTFSLSSLPLSELNCDFWDDKAAFALSPLLTSAMKRNASMAAQIEKYIKQRRVFVIAGLRHLPLGELRAFKTLLKNDASKRDLFGLSWAALEALKLEDFYKLMDKNAHNPGALNLRASEAFGSTFNLDHILKSTPSSELIPAYLFQ